MLWDVFISHSSKDKDIADRLAERLSRNFNVWYDTSNLLLGDNIEKSVKIGLKCSNFGLVIFSNNFFENYQSSLKKDELEHFISKLSSRKKVLLPILFGIDKKDMKRFSQDLKLRIDLSNIYAAKIRDVNSNLDMEISKITNSINLSLKTKKPIPKIIKKEEMEGVQLLSTDTLQNYIFLGKNQSGVDWEYSTNFFDSNNGILLQSFIYRYKRIKLAKRRYIEAREEIASRYQDGRIPSPSVGEESYGYVNNFSNPINYGVALVIYRTSNLLMRIQFFKFGNYPTIEEAGQYARIVDKKIRMLLTNKLINQSIIFDIKDEIDSILLSFIN